MGHIEKGTVDPSGQAEESRLPSTAFLTAVGLTKTFGGVRGVDSADVAFYPGQIHGLVGQNGAGKSTLAKMLCGALGPVRGRIEVEGAPVVFGSPRAALEAGVTMVAQELSLVPSLTVAENLLLGRLPTRGGFFDADAMMRRARHLVEDSGFELDPEAVLGTLSQSDRQKAEILRAIARNARLVIFDEPRSSLSVPEAERLYEILRALADDGVAVVLVTHFLAEVLQASDVVTVMRDGRVVMSGSTDGLTGSDLVEQMVGSPGVEHFASRQIKPTAGSTPRLETRNLTGRGFEDVSLTVDEGEIVGIVGLVGSGRTEFLRTVYGAEQPSGGLMLLDGSSRRFRSPRSAKRAGLAFISESRQIDGLFHELGADSNITIAHMEQTSRFGWLHRGLLRTRSSDAAQRVDVQAQSLSQPITTLSGGNQQKTLLARWLVNPPRLFLIDEPTRGVDVISTAQIHNVISELAGEGMSVLLVTSDFDEALAVAHRIYVFREGRVVGDFMGQDADKSRLLAAAFGADDPSLTDSRKHALADQGS